MVCKTLVTRLASGFRAWCRSRDYRLFLYGAPALLLGGAAIGLVASAATRSPESAETAYLDRARKAFEEKDYATALTCYDRLAHRGTNQPEVLYGLALTAEAVGQVNRAAAIMRDLAPEDDQGYGEAHLWQARHLLRTPGLPPAARQAAEAQLVQALDAGVEHPHVVHGLLGELYLARGQMDQAEHHLLKAVKARPQLRMRLAQIHLRRGDTGSARSEAQLVVSYYRARAKSDVENHHARLAWADAVTFLEEFPEAVAILTEGWTTTREPAYRLALGRVYQAWADHAARKKAPFGELLKLWEKGLENDPANTVLLDRLLASLNFAEAEGNQARATLHGLLARGEGSAAVHFALGVDAWQRGKSEQAKLHWERAHELSPRMPVVANNLAWFLATSPQPDLPRALTLVNLALEQLPNQPAYLTTRGQIYLKMKRWKEALSDLEAALPRAQDKREVHGALAEVYEQLGVPEMVAEHRKLADAGAVTKEQAPRRQ